MSREKTCLKQSGTISDRYDSPLSPHLYHLPRRIPRRPDREVLPVLSCRTHPAAGLREVPAQTGRHTPKDRINGYLPGLRQTLYRRSQQAKILPRVSADRGETGPPRRTPSGLRRPGTPQRGAGPDSRMGGCASGSCGKVAAGDVRAAPDKTRHQTAWQDRDLPALRPGICGHRPAPALLPGVSPKP